MVTESSIKDQIKKLVNVQKHDREIYQFKQELQDKPLVIEKLKNEFEATKAHLNELEENLKHIQVARKEHELDLKTKEDGIAKADGQLLELKTNKEYTAKISEMEGMKADKSIIEEKIIISFDEADVVTVDVDKEKKILAEREKGYFENKKIIEDEIAGIESKVQEVQVLREEAIKDVDANFKTRYEQVLERKEGLAIVPVVNNSCGGCYMNVTAQMKNAIKMHTELVPCGFCLRVLYLEEDLD
ncbi:MAG: putative nucleic acid-binding Zn-ribbon protein [Candidatus Omnitrophota bacterium]|jgi:predicted  nucleic acid-binding Zn-ribbon protein